MNWKIGDTFRARDTKDVRDCNIVPGTAGRIEGVNGAQVSFHLDKGHPKQGFVVGHAHVGVFNLNFLADKSPESGKRQKETSAMYPNAFPKDWFKPSGRPV